MWLVPCLYWMSLLPLASCNEVYSFHGQFIFFLHLYTATDHPSWQVIHNDSSDKMDYRDSWSGWMIYVLASIYTETDYQMSYPSLPKLVLDGWPISGINQANVADSKTSGYGWTRPQYFYLEYYIYTMNYPSSFYSTMNVEIIKNQRKAGNKLYTNYQLSPFAERYF